MEPVRTQSRPTSSAPAPVRSAPAFTRMSAVRLARSMAAGDVSAEEVVVAHLAHLTALEPTLHAMVWVDAEAALKQARRIDRHRRRGAALGPLAGVPFVVKDNIDVRRQTTSTGSRAHGGVPALRDAPVVRRLRDAGAVLLGRANMDELAMGASTQTSAFGATRNPWDLQRSPGGSSGGSAAAVAAGFAPLSIATDTGGSIREPAAQCGIVGMAPSHGLVSQRGIVPFAPRLDRVGPLTRDVADAAHLLAAMSGRPGLAGEALDPPTAPRLRVGLVRELRGAGNQPGVLARLAVAEAVLRDLGLELVTVSIPDAAAGLAAYMALTSAACVTLLEPYVRTGQVGAEVERRWLIGRDLLTTRESELVAAREVQDRLAGQARAAFAECDVLLSPTMPTTAPLLRELTEDLSDASMLALADPLHAPYTDCWAVVANLAGLAALSLPAGCSLGDGMPVGVQLAGPSGSDATLLGLAAAMEACGLAET